MKVAIPLAQGRLSLHFGHCDQFAIFETDEEEKEILSRQDASPPAHAPGVLPQWLHEQGIEVIIAGGIGMRAQRMFEQREIEVVAGASSYAEPEDVVSDYLQGRLETGKNICDH